MRKLFVYCLLASVVTIYSCNNEKKEVTGNEGYKTYSSDSLGISLEYPENFEPKNYIKPEIPISFYEVNDDSASYLFHPNVMLYIEKIPPVKISAAEYIQASRTGLKISMQSTFPGFETYAQDSLEADGIVIGNYKYDIVKNDSTSFTSKMYIAVLKGRALQFNCTTVSENFDEYEAIFDNMISSLKIKEK